MSYETLSLQKSTVEKQVEVYEKALNLERQSRQRACPQLQTYWKRENQLLSAKAASSLEESGLRLTSLYLIVGRDVDSGLVIGEIPAEDLQGGCHGSRYKRPLK